MAYPPLPLSKLLDYLQNLSILAVCKKSQKRLKLNEVWQEYEYWTIEQVVLIVLHNGGLGYAQHYLDTLTESGAAEIFSFGLPADCNIIVMACRKN